MSITPAQVAAAAVRAAKVLTACGAVVRKFRVSTAGTSCYISSKIRGVCFTVRVSNHHSRDINSDHPYYFVRLDRPHMANINGLPAYVARLASEESADPDA